MSVANEKLFSCTHNQRSISRGSFLILAFLIEKTHRSAACPSALSGTGGAVIAELSANDVPAYGSRRQTACGATGGPLTRQPMRICSVFTSGTATLPTDRKRICCG